jgi:hypothetical protein
MSNKMFLSMITLGRQVMFGHRSLKGRSCTIYLTTDQLNFLHCLACAPSSLKDSAVIDYSVRITSCGMARLRLPSEALRRQS